MTTPPVINRASTFDGAVAASQSTSSAPSKPLPPSSALMDSDTFHFDTLNRPISNTVLAPTSASIRMPHVGTAGPLIFSGATVTQPSVEPYSGKNTDGTCEFAAIAFAGPQHRRRRIAGALAMSASVIAAIFLVRSNPGEVIGPNPLTDIFLHLRTSQARPTPLSVVRDGRSTYTIDRGAGSRISENGPIASAASKADAIASSPSKESTSLKAGDDQPSPEVSDTISIRGDRARSIDPRAPLSTPSLELPTNANTPGVESESKADEATGPEPASRTTAQADALNEEEALLSSRLDPAPPQGWIIFHPQMFVSASAGAAFAEIGTMSVALPATEAPISAPLTISAPTSAPGSTPPVEPFVIASIEPLVSRPEAASSTTVPPLGTTASELAALLDRARELLSHGDIVGARRLAEFAATDSSGAALFMLAETYDPDRLARWRTRGIKPDPERARTLYRRAAEAGAPGTEARLSALASTFNAQMR